MFRRAQPGLAIGIPSLLTRTFLTMVVLVIGSSSILELLLLGSHFEELYQHIFRDSAGFASNILNADEGPLAERLARAQAATREALPTAYLVAADSDGQILAAGCETLAKRLALFPWSAFASITMPSSPLVVSNPCDVPLQFLSAAVFKYENRSAVLLLFDAPRVTSLLYSPAGVGLVILHVLPAALWMVLTTVGAMLMLRRAFFRHVSAAAETVTRFTRGDRQLRLAPSQFDDLNEISRAFNQLADEESSRLAALAAEDEGRKRMLTELIHDLKTPLTAIEAASDRLSQVTDPDQQHRYRQVIRSSLQIQSQYASMLDQLGSLPLDGFGFEREPVDISAVLQALFVQLQPTAETKSISFTLSLPEEHPILMAHQGHLQRAIQNVLSNALRYTPRGGAIRLELVVDEQNLVIRFNDTGRGIAKDDLSRVMQAFYRSSDANKPLHPDEGKGSGLGLAIVDRIMTLHGGSVSIESEPNVGTTVSLELPRAPEARPQPTSTTPQQSDAPPDGQGPKPITTAAVVLLAFFTSITTAVVGAQSFVTSSVALAVFFFFLLRMRAVRDPVLALQMPVAWEMLISVTLVTAVNSNWLVALYLGLAFTLLSSFVAYTSFLRRDYTLTICCAIALLHLPFISQTPKPFVLGAFAALVVISCALGLELLIRGTRMVSLIVRLIFLLGVTSLSITSIGLFNVIPRIILGVEEPAAERLSLAFTSLIEQHQPMSAIDERISQIAALNPLFDFAIMNRRNGRLVSEMSIPTLPGEGFSPSLFVGSESVATAPSPLARRSLLRLRSVVQGDTEQVLVVQYPSWLAQHMNGRLFPYQILSLAFAILLFNGFPVALVSLYINRLVGRRLKRIRNGIERYRASDFSTPIALNTDDALGTLIAAVDDLANRLPELGAQLKDETEMVKRFLLRCAKDLRFTESAIGDRLVEVERSGDHHKARELLQTAEQQRKRLENLLELFQIQFVPDARHAESIPLLEILDEELSRAQQRAAGAGQLLEIEMPANTTLSGISGDPGVCIEALRHLVDLAMTGSAPAPAVEVKVKESEREATVEISMPRLSLTEADLTFLADPLQSGIGTGGETLPMGGYRTVKLCRLFERFGWRMQFLNSAPRGCIARLSFIRHPLSALLFILAIYASFDATRARALDLPLCTGYDPVEKVWGMRRLNFSHREIVCPNGMAYLLLGLTSSAQQDAQPPRGSCCPLPPGALLPEHSYARLQCPSGTVMTGVRGATYPATLTQPPPYSRRFEVRCTKVDSTKYTLVPVQTTLKIDSITDIGRRVAGSTMPITNAMRLPPELRFGLGRISRVQWEGGCVGYPWGAIVTSAELECAPSQFMELRSIDGQSMQSHCAAVKNIYSPEASCVEQR